MAPSARQPDLIADAESISNDGPVRLWRTNRDVRGAIRFKPQYIISPSSDDDETFLAAFDATQLGRAAAAIDADEISIKWPRSREIQLRMVLTALETAGFQREEFWPTVSFLGASKDELIVRTSRAAMDAAITGPFFRAYAEERRRCTVDGYRCALVASLQNEIKAIAARLMLGSSFDARYRIERIMNVGSTSRGTYASFPADFDLVVHTESERTNMEDSDVKNICSSLVECIAQSDAFERYWQAIPLLTSMPNPGRPSIQLESFGVRGPQSLVARYDLVWPDSRSIGKYGFLDVTFGKLPQIIGYEISIRRIFENLGPFWAERLRAEIRIAKSILRSLGDVYGSANRGLRAHVVEQWIIQSFGYRSSGVPVGTLDNALRLIVEESAAVIPGGSIPQQAFEAFKERFPLWHLGWWESEMGFEPGARNVNLWDLLGDGNASEAEQKWRKLVVLGLAFDRKKLAGETWKIEDLVESAKSELEPSYE